MCLLSFAAGMFGANRLLGAGPLTAPKEVWIHPGMSGFDMAKELSAEGVVYDPYSFLLAVRAQSDGRDIKAGEYRFNAYQPLQSVIEQMRRGDVIVRQVTLPEGWSVAEAAQMLQADPLLDGDVGVLPPEGSLLPETYQFVRGDTRAMILNRMKAAMDKTLAELWANRAPDLPVTTPQQAVTMAAIVEKETALPAERPRIAAVYENRLRKNMLLQADPTVVYTLTKGTRPLGRPLTLNDLATPSPYNTYTSPGLPPGPIANPGRASLEAVLHPETNDFLYFVADGTGGHVFAATLAEHDKNVANWRKIEKQNAK